MEYMSTKNITKEIRETLKKEFPNCKFSVSFNSYSGGASIDISLVKANFNPFVDGYKPEHYYQINHFYIKDSENLSDKGKDLFIKVNNIVNKRRYDNSDSQTDYFDTNFYYDLNIGKWNKPFVQLTGSLKVKVRKLKKLINKEVIK